MAAITFDNQIFVEKKARPVLRQQTKPTLCSCGRLVVEPDTVQPNPADPVSADPVSAETGVRPTRPRFEGQWRTLLYI